MLLYYEECGIFKGFGCPTYEEEYDRCTNFQFPRQSAKLSNVSNKKNVLVLAAVFHSVATEYLIIGIEFYLFVSHGGMKRQRVHV